MNLETNHFFFYFLGGPQKKIDKTGAQMKVFQWFRFNPPKIKIKSSKLWIISLPTNNDFTMNATPSLPQNKNNSPTQKCKKKHKQPTELPDIFSVATGAVSNFVAFSQPAAALGTVPTRCRCEARRPSGWRPRELAPTGICPQGFRWHTWKSLVKCQEAAWLFRGDYFCLRYFSCTNKVCYISQLQ